MKFLNENTAYNFSYPQVRQQWFSVGIFPFRPSFGLTGIENRRGQITRSPHLRVASYVGSNAKITLS
jgi:hypothetical protein